MEGRKRLTRSAAKSHPQQLQSENNEASSPLLIKRRRTMPSKYEPNYGERLEQKQQNTPTDAKSDKKRRRSSFVRGRSRKSIGVVNTEVTEIHMKIPMDETPEERLRLLKLACFEYTMSKLHEEFPILETMENFRPTGKEEFHKSLQELVEDGTLKSACYSSSRNENPLNLEMETHISQLDERIKTLSDESKQWDEMLTSYTQRTEEATAKPEPQSMPVNEPETLSVTQRKLLSELPGLDVMISAAGKIQENVTLQVNQLVNSCKQVEQFQESVDAFLSQETNRLAKESVQGFAAINDPHTLLEKSGK